MSVRAVVLCDAIHAERTPPECRGFLALRNSYGRDDIEWQARQAGWVYDLASDTHRCPSCAQPQNR